MTPPASLADKYDLERAVALVNGRQALVRLLLMQRELDRREGRDTAGFVSGYRGSPLGGLDTELAQARAALDASRITFVPGLNEDLAMTALAGTQQIDFVAGRRAEGVFGLWYGKGPGVDRSGDAIKHANLAGVSRHGGLVLAFGDDHSGKSSTTAHQSDLTLASWDVPVLYPADVGEIIDYGLAAFAMSRFTGALVGLKLVNETADATAVLEALTLPTFVLPEHDGRDDVHVRLETRAMLEQDARLVRRKLPLARAFAQANQLDRIVFGARHPRLLVACAGKTYPDVLAALARLGIDAATAVRLGLGVYKIALLFPLDDRGLGAAAADAEEILFVEEKRAHAETQARALLYGRQPAPRITGKQAPDGSALLPADLPLDPATVAEAIAARLLATIPHLAEQSPALAERLAAATTHARRLIAPPVAIRRPAFCPGCPHSLSTRVPDGAHGATGIGCHGMVLFHPERKPLPMGHMGGEGAQWIGLSHFTDTPHIFQNLGDGTYSHSGSLAIRAAVAAGINITYKILFNDAVAMTGGQPVEGALSVAAIARQMQAEGVQAVEVVAEHPDRFGEDEPLPDGVRLHARDTLMEVQERLRAHPGVSVIIFDQVCAAEKRRRRKSQRMEDPTWRVFIHPEVCEGCGDCSVQSHCMALQPLDTHLGRKRKIDQSACNKDISCTQGFCPSFVIVQDARPRRQSSEASHTPPPAPAALQPLPAEGFDLVIAGVGGTGVTTVAAILGMAARLEGLGAQLYDMTGLSQKGGAVFSHVRLRHPGASPVPARVGPAEADMILACDLVAAVHPEVTATIASGRTRVFANDNVQATAEFHAARDHQVSAEALLPSLADAAKLPVLRVAASDLALDVCGDSIVANMVLLGYAWQSGRLPLRLDSIEQAIQMNGRASAANLQALAAGRRAAAGGHPQQVATAASPPSLAQFVEHRARDLHAYWNAAYAQRYRGLMDEVRDATAALDHDEAFAWAVARSAYKLMAYKDEYEVARLYTDGRLRTALAAEFEHTGRIRLQLAPPLLSRPDPRTGRPRKRSFGAWILPLLSMLARLRGLRETPLDLLGWQAERRLERSLRDLFLVRIAQVARSMTPANREQAVALALAPLDVRGFGPVKMPAAQALRARLEALDH